MSGTEKSSFSEPQLYWRDRDPARPWIDQPYEEYVNKVLYESVQPYQSEHTIKNGKFIYNLRSRRPDAGNR